MKQTSSLVSGRVVWHVCHAFTLLLLSLVLFERLVPGAVLGHIPLFLAVPLLVLCIGFHSAAKQPARWWMLIDLWFMTVLSIGRILILLTPSGPLAWLLAGFASMLVLSFLWIFSTDFDPS